MSDRSARYALVVALVAVETAAMALATALGGDPVPVAVVVAAMVLTVVAHLVWGPGAERAEEAIRVERADRGR